jgi:tRNA 2-selenouridine synthase
LKPDQKSGFFMQTIDVEEFLRQSKEIPIIDVRSPGEYASGHIPGAISMPLFNDHERAIIGTIYVQQGKNPAIETGLEITGPKMAEFIRNASKTAREGKLLVHCWRGGMRSESMAWLYERIGINCGVLKGGYKAYRNFLLNEIGKIPYLIVIQGPTGCGKTEILQMLKSMNEQIIDLEDLANHKGSVFGGICKENQPSTQQFQNDLLFKILSLDKSKRIFVEGESQTIGKIFLPDAFWSRMNDALIININVPREYRIKRLTIEYGSLPLEEMKNAINSLSKRLGEVRKDEILTDYLQGNIESAADKLLDYYDKTYDHSVSKYKNKGIEITLPDNNAEENAKIILSKITDQKI